jgi:hypothetical protein
MKTANSSGERLYKDSDGVKRNLRGMIHAEPEWAATRFAALEAEVERLTAIDAGSLLVLETQHKEIERLRGLCGRLYREAVCEGKFTISTLDDLRQTGYESAAERKEG